MAIYYHSCHPWHLRDNYQPLSGHAMTENSLKEKWGWVETGRGGRQNRKRLLKNGRQGRQRQAGESDVEKQGRDSGEAYTATHPCGTY